MNAGVPGVHPAPSTIELTLSQPTPRPEEINALHAGMLTGDHEFTARAVAHRLGIERYEAGVDPEGRQRFVERLRAAGRSVAMAGRGVNDAPALAAADVGIAIAPAGTAAAAAMSRWRRRASC